MATRPGKHPWLIGTDETKSGAYPKSAAFIELRSTYDTHPYKENPNDHCRRPLDFRLIFVGKASTTRAADLRGVLLSAFVRDAVLREAESIMPVELTVILSPEESRRFVKAMDAPFPCPMPN